MLSDWNLVHKIIWNKKDASIVFAKFISPDMKVTRFFLGTMPYKEKVTAADCLELMSTGIEVFSGAMDTFWNKSDYKEHDLLTDTEQYASVEIA